MDAEQVEQVEQVEQADPRSRRARWAVTAVFGMNGVLIATLVVRTPSLKQDLDLTDGRLGLLAALFGVAGVLAMQVTGALTARLGSGTIVRIAALVLPVLLVGIGVAPHYAAMAVLQLAFGAVHGMLDVSMNVHAVAVERAAGRRILSGCHGAWSIGSVIGALLGSGAAHLGMSRTEHYLLLSALLVPAGLVAGRFLLPAAMSTPATTPAPTPSPAGRAGPSGPRGRAALRTAWGARRTAWGAWRTGWTWPLLVLGAMGATVLTAESAVISWSGVFLHDDRRASLGLAGLAYVAFAGCQTSLRLVGDRVQARVPAARLLSRSGGYGAAGVVVAVLSPWPWLSIAGFGLVGLSLSLSLPVLFGLVGHLGAETAGGDAGAATTVSRFTTMTYTGLLFGPAAIGWVADHLGLTWTLALLAPLLLAVAAAARTVDLARRRPGPVDGGGARAGLSAS